MAKEYVEVGVQKHVAVVENSMSKNGYPFCGVFFPNGRHTFTAFGLPFHITEEQAARVAEYGISTGHLVEV